MQCFSSSKHLFDQHSTHKTACEHGYNITFDSFELHMRQKLWPSIRTRLDDAEDDDCCEFCDAEETVPSSLSSSDDSTCGLLFVVVVILFLFSFISAMLFRKSDTEIDPDSNSSLALRMNTLFSVDFVRFFLMTQR